MPLPQESVNVQLDKNGKLPEEGLDAIKRDIAALCRDARGAHNNLQNRDAEDCHPISAVTELQAELDGKASTSHAATHLPDGSDPLTSFNQRGLLSARPAASASNVGLQYTTTDSGARTVTRSNGTSYDEMPVSFRDRQAINIKDYGAVGDGVTDDYAAIVAAIAAAQSGSAVYFPPGTYRSSAIIEVSKLLTLFGENYEVTTLLFDQTIPWTNKALVQVTKTGFQLYGIHIDGQSPTNAQPLLTIYDADGTTGAVIERCKFSHMYGRAALLVPWTSAQSGVAGIGNIKVRFCRFESGDGAGAIQITTEDCKGVDGIEVSFNEMVDVGGPVCKIADTDSAADGKLGGFTNTIVSNNRIEVNSTGVYGPIPAELWGHDNLQCNNNTVLSGTRGLGMAQCRDSAWVGNVISNQTAYACEISGCQRCTFLGNTITDCSSFVFDTTLAPDTASSDITIASNNVTGSGITSPSSAYCIRTNAVSTSSRWTVSGNTFRNYTNGLGLINLRTPIGSGGDHAVLNNVYIVDEETSTFAFNSQGGPREICAGNVIRISANWTASNPQEPGGTAVIYNNGSQNGGRIIGNRIIFSGSGATSRLFALGTTSATVTATGITIDQNIVEGELYYIIAFPSDSPTCRCAGNVWDLASGTISIPAAVSRSNTKARYESSAVPSAGTWARGDIVYNSAPSVNSILRWACVSGGTPGTWQPDYLHNWDGAAGTSRHARWYTGGSLRWSIGVGSVAESGSDAGSRFEILAYSDAGALLGTVLFINRAINGELRVERNTTRFYPAQNTRKIVVLDGWNTSQPTALDWSTGNTIQWRWERQATSQDIQLKAYSSGSLTDTPMIMTNAANGVWTLARPLKFVHATAAATPGANEVTVGAGQIKTASDATIGGTLTSSAAVVLKVTSVTSAAGTTAIAATDDVVVVTGTTTQTLTLPACATGRRLILKNRSTGTVTVNRAGSDTIDGATSYTMTGGANTSITLVGNGTDWVIV